MFERYTDRARRTIVLAQEQVRLTGGAEITSAHLLAGLAREAEGVAGLVLADMGVSVEMVEEQIRTETPVPAGHIPFTTEAKRVLEQALRVALRLGHPYIGTEHLLLGIVALEDACDGGRVLGELAPFGAVEQAVLDRLGKYDDANAPEFDLMALPGTSRGLMHRYGGNGPWRQIAVFDSYNDAERVLELLRRGLRARASA